MYKFRRDIDVSAGYDPREPQTEPGPGLKKEM